jgi:hypothetical protein
VWLQRIFFQINTVGHCLTESLVIRVRVFDSRVWGTGPICPASWAVCASTSSTAFLTHPLVSGGCCFMEPLQKAVHVGPRLHGVAHGGQAVRHELWHLACVILLVDALRARTAVHSNSRCVCDADKNCLYATHGSGSSCFGNRLLGAVNRTRHCRPLTFFLYKLVQNWCKREQGGPVWSKVFQYRSFTVL